MAVYTSKDVPVNEYGLQWRDQPVLCGPPLHPPISGTEMGGPNEVRADIVRCEGDQVAVIVAETEAIATQARTSSPAIAPALFV